MAPTFPPATLTFLRSLARHNDRQWFRARRDRYEADVKAPMAAVIEQLDRDFRSFAPELIASPKISMFRIYRDTRFSEDKTPLKTSIAAVFPHRALPKGIGAGLYFEVNPKSVGIAGGIYAPGATELRLVRLHVSANLKQFQSIVQAPSFVKDTGGLQGDALVRMPRGFAADDPAAPYLRMKQFLVWREWPAADATGPTFYDRLLRVFRAAAPLVRFLNEPLIPRRRR